MIDHATRINHTPPGPPPTLISFHSFKRGEMVELVGTTFSTSTSCDKLQLACGNHDHSLSVAKVIMKILKGQEELDQFTLTRGEYANKIEKSPNAVRMMMRHGKLSGEYRFDGSKYLFKSPTRPRVSYDNDHSNSIRLTTPKAKKINRGNHFEADYPNDAFRLHNEMKKEQANINKIQGKFKSKEHEIEYNKLNEEALKAALAKTEKIQKNSFTPLKDYGGPVAMRRGPPIEIDSYESRSPIRKPFMGYDSMGSYDDGSVEIDLSRSRPVSNGEPQFKDKIQESIWRLKNNK